MRAESLVFHKEYGELNSKGELRKYKPDISGNNYYVDIEGKWELADSTNMLPSKKFFGSWYYEMLLKKRECYIASNNNAVISEEMYNTMPYQKIIEYCIINLTLN